MTSSTTSHSSTVPLCVDYKEHIRPVIDVIDSLRDLGIDRDLPLPVIVVVGDQSAEKSSVLEMLSFVELPRGSGIVTRCPLEIRLKSSNEDWKCMISYDTSSSDSTIQSDKISHPSKVAEKILTDLTLIDLPGITRIPTVGQEEDSCNMIRKMIEGYIRRDDTIILAIIPAVADLATSDALAMARKHDPNFLRTIGVVTKPDMIGSGNEEELVKIVNNEKYTLKLGYTLVKCRSAADSTKRVSLNEALTAEQTFFENHSHIHLQYWIIGVSVGGFVLLIIIIVIVSYCLCWKSKQNNQVAVAAAAGPISTIAQQGPQTSMAASAYPPPSMFNPLPPSCPPLFAWQAPPDNNYNNQGQYPPLAPGQNYNDQIRQTIYPPQVQNYNQQLQQNATMEPGNNSKPSSTTEPNICDNSRQSLPMGPPSYDEVQSTSNGQKLQ